MDSLLEPLERGERTATSRAPVVLAVALDQSYDYLVPDGLELQPGAFVLVPFGPQSRIGVVWDRPVGEAGKTVDPSKLDFSKFEEAGTLLALLGRFPKALASAAAAYEPSMLTNYVLDVAQTANHFYKEHRVIGEPAEIEMARLAVVDAARVVLANGLRLLGVQTPDEM